LTLGRELFQRNCVACHGSRGKGDGPAAVALNPRPADLTRPERVPKLPDDSLLHVVAKGRNGMPAFEKLLTADQILEVVAYLRSLKP